jgi:hypothetical protein
VKISSSLYSHGLISIPQKLQLAWETNITACWRPATDFNHTYISVARLDSHPNAQDIGTAFGHLAGCCDGQENIYLARRDCGGVACFSNDLSLIQQWDKCAAGRITNYTAFASKIDYEVYKDVSEQWEKQNGAASSVVMRWMLLGCIAGSMMILHVV